MGTRGQIVDRSGSGGLSIAEAWDALFAANELNFRDGRYARVLDDEQLRRRMRDQFPRRPALKRCSVSRVRAARNRVHGEVRYWRYVRMGKQVLRATARGLPVPRSS